MAIKQAFLTPEQSSLSLSQKNRYSLPFWAINVKIKNRTFVLSSLGGP